MGQSSNQFGIYIQTDKIIGIFSFSKYYRVSTNKRTGQLMMNGILMSNNLHVVTFPDKTIPDFFDKIINYYETGDKAQMKNLLNQRQEEMEQAFSKSGDE